MKTFYPYDPANPQAVTGEVHKIIGGQIRLLHIPVENSIDIAGFNQASSAAALQSNEFFCHYSADTVYREANRIVYFNRSLNGRSVAVSYLACGSPVTADDMNEIKDHITRADKIVADVKQAQTEINNKLVAFVSDAQRQLVAHNADANAHYDIRRKISIVDELNAQAHAKINGDIQAARTFAINQARDFVSDHNNALAAHSDIRKAVDDTNLALRQMLQDFLDTLDIHDDNHDAHEFIRGQILTEETARKLDVEEIWHAIDGLSTAAQTSTDELETVYVKQPDLAEYVRRDEISDVVRQPDLTPLARKSDLNKFITADALKPYALKTQLNVLPTVPATIEGGFWLDFDEDHHPVLKVLHGGEALTFVGTSTIPEGAQTYTFAHGNDNYVAAYNSDDIIFLAPDMKISDAVFNADSVEISFADGSTATIGGINYGSRVQFVDSEEKRHVLTFNFGRIVEGDAVTLTSDFAADVFDAGQFTSVTAAKSPVQITGSNQPSSLIGGKNSDTLVGNSEQDTFTGGGGSNVFVVKHDATITDFHPAADKLIVDTAAFDGVHIDASGLTLTSSSDQIVLCGVEAGTVTVNDEPIFFSDGIIANAEKTSITLVGGQLDCADFPNADIAEAHVNTSVKARDSGMILTGHDATLVGGGGNDTFLCADDLTLQAVGGGDCISLDGFTLQSSDYSRVTERLTLKISDGNATANIVVENYDRTEPVPVWQIINDSPVSLYPDIPDEFIFSSNNPANATQVTVNTQHGDFGRQSSIPPPSTDDHIGGKEYYLSLYTVQAAQSDSTLIANQKVNYIFAIGGTRNALTGGLAADRFNFTTSGGVVTDFGVGATNSSKKATATTNTKYDRNDPRTYEEGIDILQVDGVVKEVAFDGFGKGSSTAANETFVAYVTYTATDGNDYTVALLNICKKASGSAYQTDDIAAKSLKIWDTSSGEMKVISATDLVKFFVNTADSAFAGNIANIADMVAQYHHNNGIIGR